MKQTTEAVRQMDRFKQIERQIAQVFNRHCVDCDFNIPDFILARLVMRHLQTLMALQNEIKKHENISGELKGGGKL